MNWLAGIAGVAGYVLAYLEERKYRRQARNKCPHCWFVNICDRGDTLTKGMSPCWQSCTLGRYRQELIKGE